MTNPRFRRSTGGVSSLASYMVRCPKSRRRVVGGLVAGRLNELLADIAAERSWQIVAREVVPDHVHIFVRVVPTDSPAEVAQRLEGRTSRVRRSDFCSKSYFATSVGYLSEQTVRRHVEHQGDAA